MGVGLGVEAVAAGLMQASEVYGIDVHIPSVEASIRNYEIHVGSSLAPFVGIVSDLWANVENGHRFDVITFNPPLINYQLSEDKEISRNLCQGLTLADSFLRQTNDRETLAMDGSMFIVLSNTAPLRDFLTLVLHYGFNIKVLHEQGWPGEEVQTYIFEIRHKDQT
jgi:release factor glutamine methyltransferase